MKDINDQILLADRRFLMDLLTEENPLNKDAHEKSYYILRASDKDILIQQEKYKKYSKKASNAFSNACSSILQLLSRKEFNEWAEIGLELFKKSNENLTLIKYFFKSSPKVISAASYSYFESWAQQGESILKISIKAAIGYFGFSSNFLNYANIYQIRKWAEYGIDLINLVGPEDDLCFSFFQKSIYYLSFMTIREMNEWKNLGLLLFTLSPAIGKDFFLKEIKLLEKLNWQERNILYKLTAALAKTNPKKSLAFFKSCPKLLQKVNPNSRDILLTITEEISKKNQSDIFLVFKKLWRMLKTRSYPDQQVILKQGEALIKLYPDAAPVFFNNVNKILSRIDVFFLPDFVHKGICIANNNDILLSQYFSLTSKEAVNEILDWENAIKLDDFRHLLMLFAEAMTGEKLNIENSISIEDKRRHESRIYPASDGRTIFLPPFIKGSKSRNDNYLEFKIATAHQAGYIEYGTFKGGLDLILKLLLSLPDKDLALDIFFILEDGRIDFMLRSDYRGLKDDLDFVLSKALSDRTSPFLLPFKEALVEILLRITLDLFDEKHEIHLHHNFVRHIDFLKNAVSGFFTSFINTWDCFVKTLEIYNYLSTVANSPAGFVDNQDDYRPHKKDLPPYQPISPLSYRGRLDPCILTEPIEAKAKSIEHSKMAGGTPLSPDELKMLLELLGYDLNNIKISNDKTSGPGIFIKDLDGKFSKNILPDKEESVSCDNTRCLAGLLKEERPDYFNYYYDEWDYLQKSYRKKWCRIREKTIIGNNGGLIDDIYSAHQALIQKVKKQFQNIKPKQDEKMPRVEQGDEIDLCALIQTVADKKAGGYASDKIFIRREKKIRKIAVLFLVDMSASTGNPVPDSNNANEVLPQIKDKQNNNKKKIIDIEIESLVVIMEALEALNDDYAIFGFSGYGRDSVDFFRIKDFSDQYSEKIKMRISGINPKQSTRMGPAIRHSTAKLASMESEQRLLILLSDGFPQDCDYGEDRTSHEYGLHDTMMALIESKNQGIKPFCITVDQSGNDYLKKMCDPKSYLVIKDIFSLPEILPKVVESLII